MMVTAKDAEEDKVRGFEAGADDYVTKPFSMKELVARINANLKGARPASGARSSRPATSSSTRRTLLPTSEERPLDLRLKEFELLAALASAPGRAQEPGGAGEGGLGARRRWLLAHHRRPHTQDPRRPGGESSYQYIHTARGLGYRFEAKSRDVASGRRSTGSRRAQETRRHADPVSPDETAEGQQDPARLRRERLPRAEDAGDEPQTAGREPGRDHR